jgi:DnaJ-class molecular chaperone
MSICQDCSGNGHTFKEVCSTCKGDGYETIVENLSFKIEKV